MKKLLALAFMSAALVTAAQPRKAPKMAPVLEEGYYVTSKGDTVRGEIQSNPEDETELYRQFSFKPARGGKVMPVTTKKAKAYGFGGKHFVMVPIDGEDAYLERLTQGRLNFFKRQFMGKIDGYPAVESEYYIQDNRAEGDDVGLRDVRKISTKFYKRDLKPYLKDQLMIWTDLDKFTFNEGSVVNAINEFNKYYVIEGN